MPNPLSLLSSSNIWTLKIIDYTRKCQQQQSVYKNSCMRYNNISKQEHDYGDVALKCEELSFGLFSAVFAQKLQFISRSEIFAAENSFIYSFSHPAHHTSFVSYFFHQLCSFSFEVLKFSFIFFFI